MINRHKKEYLDMGYLECPFAISITGIEWDHVLDVVSLDDIDRTIIVRTSYGNFLVNIPFCLYDSLYKAGEQNVIEQDLGFNDQT